MRTTRLGWSAVALMSVALSACSGGGSGSGSGGSSPKPVSFTANQMTLSGQASWPGASTVAVTVDDEPVTVSAGNWSHALTLNNSEAKTVRIAIIADGVTVALREVTVSR